MNKETIRNCYTTRLNWLENNVKHEVASLLMDARAEFQRRFTDIAPPKLPECRVKGIGSLLDKLDRRETKEKGKPWTVDDVLTIAENGDVTPIVDDLVGGRLACGTPSDAKAIVAIIESWNSARIRLIRSEAIHFQSGYRAHHIQARIRLFEGGKELWFPIEIQIKTLLQDAWANFGHDEFYKPAEEPPEISKQISKFLADVLEGLDKIGQAIRDERLRRRPAPTSIGAEETLVTPKTLSYLAKEYFDVEMNNVELNRSAQQLRAYGYDNIASVSALLEDKEINNLIKVAKAGMNLGGDVTPFESFFFAPVVVKDGKEALQASLLRFYGLTESTCHGCACHISSAEVDFIDTRTDLDSVYYCERCRDGKLNRCAHCPTLTESYICKNCRAVDPAAEII